MAVLPSFADLPATIIHPATVLDARQNEVYDYDHPVRTVPLVGWRNPAGTAKTQGGEDVSEDRWLLFLPEGADVTESCAVDVAGGRWLVEGTPQAWSSPTGALSHVQVTLTRYQPEEG